VTAVGGGTVRDLVLGDLPAVWIRDPSYLGTATLAALMTFLGARLLTWPGRWLLIADAFALALMTMAGAKKALALGMMPPIAVAMGVITGVAGGVLRDVLTGEIPLVFRPHIYLYATAALLGAITFVFMAKLLNAPQSGLITGAAVTLGLRLAAMRWKLGLPIFTSRAVSPPAADT
jgi:uncharacterized membrane protein YeiH